MRLALLPALALSLALCVPLAARAGSAMTMGIYLWKTDGDSPTKLQYLSVADGKTEYETDGNAGIKSQTHATTDAETKLIEAAIDSRMKALTLQPPPAPKLPYVVVEWTFTKDSTFTEGSARYPLASVPPSVVEVQKQLFGATYDGAAD